jgi:AbiV family abortive infection protein
MVSGIVQYFGALALRRTHRCQPETPNIRVRCRDCDQSWRRALRRPQEAAGLFERQSFSTSAFLAITVIEETAKAHVAIFRKDRPEGTIKGRDPLHDHRMKHRMAILPPMFISDRLERALGKDTCVKLQKEAETTGFTATREAGGT